MNMEAEANVEFTADDISIVGQVADEGKDKSDLWKEIQAEKHGTAEPAQETAAEASDESDKAEIPAADEAAGDEGTEQEAATAAEPAPAATAAEEETSSEGDIWANATPEQREAYKALEQRIKSDDGRVATYQREVRDLRSQLAAPPRKGRDGKGDIKDAISKIEAIKEDYPDIAGPLEAIANVVDGGLNDMQAAEERRHRAAQHSAAASVDYETSRLDKLLPGWGKYLDDNEDAYVAWVQDGNTPAWVIPAVRRNKDGVVDADEAFRLVTLFQEHMNQTGAGQANAESEAETASEDNQKLKTKRELQRRSTNGPKTTSGAPVTTGIPEDGNKSTMWKQIQREKAQKRKQQAELYG